MAPNFNSIYLPYAGTSRPWLGMDTQENLRKNLTEFPDLMEQWRNREIRYQFNSHGFRCDEFSDTDSIMFLGCSITLGMALPSDLTWTTQVARALGLRCVNLAQGGASADTAFRMCLGWIERIKPRYVVYLKPPRIRWELVWDDRIEFCGAWRTDWKNSQSPYMHYVNDYMEDDNNDYFNDRKNTLAIESLCRQQAVPLLIYDSRQDLISLQIQNPEDIARDCLHPGVLANHTFAQRVIEDIQNMDKNN